MLGLLYFFGSLALLVLGFLVYGKFVENTFGADSNRLTPVNTKNDGVDYQRLPKYKIFLIQFLNIAGLGPVLGPILGALYGPSALLWIVFGCIFFGAVHDYCSGMMSLRYGGASYPEVIGRNLGSGIQKFMEVFAILFMVLVGAVFVLAPAALLANMTGIQKSFWIAFIFAYYFLATILPIDTIIGRIYPFFALLLILMVFGLTLSILINGYDILPNTNFLVNTHPEKLPIWPLLCITIACGAISGFHATQSPIVARCMQNEKDGRKIFYGAMIAEGIVGIIWTMLALSFYKTPEALNAVIQEGTPTLVVKNISVTLLGAVGGILAILGVIVLPISTGDTAFRVSRIMLSDALHIDQKNIISRIFVAAPLFAAGIALTFIQFDVIWRYFAWANQTMACVTLWAVSIFLARRAKFYWIATIPALFMTIVCVSYFCNAQIGFQLPVYISTWIGVYVAVICLVIFLILDKRFVDDQLPLPSERGDLPTASQEATP